MNAENLSGLLGQYIASNLSVAHYNDASILNLPFTDHDGNPMQIQVSFKDGALILEDLGHSAGLLFSLGMHGADNPAHLLLKNISKHHAVTMDYDQGVLRVTGSDKMLEETVLDFVKVLLTIDNALPCFPVYKKEAKIGNRLVSRLANDIVQLRLPNVVQKQAEIEGKLDRWTVSYRYPMVKFNERFDVSLLAVDLDVKEPRKAAEHIITLAWDVLAVKDHRELRVVYQVDPAMSPDASNRAGELLDGFQTQVGYYAFNYANPDIRTNLRALTTQELSPLVPPSV